MDNKYNEGNYNINYSLNGFDLIINTNYTNYSAYYVFDTLYLCNNENIFLSFIMKNEIKSGISWGSKAYLSVYEALVKQPSNGALQMIEQICKNRAASLHTIQSFVRFSKAIAISTFGGVIK